jgi:hypothetical protein
VAICNVSAGAAAAGGAEVPQSRREDAGIIVTSAGSTSWPWSCTQATWIGIGVDEATKDGRAVGDWSEKDGGPTLRRQLEIALDSVRERRS